MREIKGYVFIESAEGRRRALLGPRTSEGADTPEPLEENGLKAYAGMQELLRAFAAIADRARADTFQAGFIRLLVAENEADVGRLAQVSDEETEFAVVFGRGPKIALIGAYAEGGVRIFDSGGYMRDGASPVKGIEAAKRLAEEAARQGQEPAAVALYRLREIR